MTIYNVNQFILSCITLFICISCKSQQKSGNLFKIDPAIYQDGYGYLVFPFNDTFIKANKIKTIAYGKPTNKYINEFDKNGHLIKTYLIQIKDQSQKIDTLHREERLYNSVTGLLDTLIEFHESDRLFVPDADVSCYQYDKQSRLDKILKFGLYEVKPGERKDEKTTNYYGLTDLPMPPPVESDIKLEPVNKLCIHGRAVDPTAFNTMIRNNDFSSIGYNYYMKDKVAVEEQTELYDFLKKYGKTDTCKSKRLYHSYNNRVFLKFNQFDCKGRDDIPSEYYRYKNGLLDSIVQVYKFKPDVHFIYDSSNNLTVLYGISKGEKVSILEMTYDDKGLLKALRRKPTLDKDNWFMVDNTLIFETKFF